MGQNKIFIVRYIYSMESDNQTTRCEECYKKWRRNNVKNNVKKYREVHQNVISTN